MINCILVLISSSGHLRTWQKPPPSHPQKLHMEERKEPGFLQCKILLRNFHSNSQRSFEGTWVWEGAEGRVTPKPALSRKAGRGCLDATLPVWESLIWQRPIVKAFFFTRVENMDVGIGLHCNDCQTAQRSFLSSGCSKGAECFPGLTQNDFSYAECSAVTKVVISMWWLETADWKAAYTISNHLIAYENGIDWKKKKQRLV